MDQPQYSNLLEGLHAVPDPRHARGKQLEWSLLWGVIAAAVRGALARGDDDQQRAWALGDPPPDLGR